MKNIFSTLILLMIISSASHYSFAQCTPVGDPAVFGNNVWNVYAWNAGGASDAGTSWNTNYAGYYVDTNLNLNTQSRWSNAGSPSDAIGYTGCTVSADNHSWSAKRTGFPSGYYYISIPGHDDEAQLYVNGIPVWEHDGCCDSHGGVWSGFLCGSSSVEFRCTEGGGASYGSISFGTVSAFTSTGSMLSCTVSGVTLSANINGSYLWSTGATSSSVTVNAAGTYSLTISNASGCSIGGSINIASESSPTATFSGSTCLGAGNLTGSFTGNPSRAEWKLNGSIVYRQSPTWSSGVTAAAGNGAGNANNQLNYPRGICFDGADNLYVVDFWNYRVQKFAPGSTIGVTVAGGNGQGSSANQLYQPEDVAVDVSGNVYVADNGRVVKWAPGATSGVTVASSSYPDYYFSACWIYLDASNNIYVSDYGGARVFKFTSGNSTPVVVAGGNGNGSAANQLSNPYDIYVDGNANVYVCDYSNSRIQKWAPGASEGVTVLGDGSNSSSITSVYHPKFMTMDGAGNTYVVTDASQVRFFPAGSASCTEIANYNTWSAWAEGIALAANHDLYVVNGYNGHVVKKYAYSFSSATYIPAAEGSYSLTVTSFDGCTSDSSPLSVYASPVITNGSLFSDCSGSAITLYAGNTSGYVWSPGNVSGSSATFYPASTTTYTLSDLHNCTTTAQVVVPVTPTVSISGSACTGSTLTATTATIPASLQWQLNGTTVRTDAPVWNQTATTVAGGNGNGSGANQLSYTFNGIFVDPAGNIYISDRNNGRIQKWAPGANSGVTVAGGNGNYGSNANQINNPNGIFVDSLGNIYIADTYNHRVQKWAPGATSGTTVAGGNGQGNALNQFSDPTLVYVDAAGNVYVNDESNRRVMKWASGATEGVVVAGGNGQGTGSNQIYYGAGMCVDDAGNVYVTDGYYQGRIVKWAPGASTGTTIMSGLSYPAGLWRDGAGYFYVSQGSTNSNVRIERFKEGDYTYQDIFISGSGSGANQLYSSSFGCFDIHGSMYVLDGGNFRVQKFSVASISQTFAPSSSGDYTAVATSFFGCTANSNVISVIQSPVVSSPLSIICPGSSITITATNSGSFTWNPGNQSGASITVTPSSTTTYTVTDNGSNCSSTVTIFTNPVISSSISGVACIGGGSLNANLNGTPTILEWKKDSATVYTAAAPTYLTSSAVVVAGGNGNGANLNQVSYPRGIARDLAGNIYVAEEGNHRVTKWAPGATTGVVVAGGNGSGNAANQLQSPEGVFVDREGNIYVADNGNSRIQKWAPGATLGVTVAGGNGNGSALYQLSYIYSVHVDDAGNIYVPDEGNHRVVKWAPGSSQGTVVAGGNGPGSAANQLYYPFALTFDAQGNMYIADQSNHRIQKWEPGATSGTTVAGGNGYGYNMDQVASPTGVVVDGFGNVYTLNSSYSYIVKWAPGATTGTYIAGYYSNYNPTGPGVIWGANSLRADESGNLYVADYVNCRVQKFPAAFSSNTYTPTAPGSFTAVTTSFFGCTSTSNAVDVHNYPTISFSGNTYFCDGSSTALDAGSHQQYAWSTGSTAQSESFNTAGNYSIAVTDYGCATTKNFYIASQTPVLNVAATPSTTCFGNTSQLNAVLTSGGLQYYSKTYYIDGNHLSAMPYSCSNARYGYYYQGQCGFYFADSGIGTATAIKVEFNVGAQYSANNTRPIWINNNSNNGTFIAPYDNNCNENPANFVNVDLTSTNGYVVGGTNTINLYNSYFFGLVPTSALNSYYARVTVQYQKAIVSYSWAPGGDTIANPVVTPPGTTTYTVTATSFGCSSTSNVTVTVAPAPGDTSVFGNHAWNVYAFNAGGQADNGHSWKDAYSGYYVDTNLSFNTQARWNSYSSPSGASGYTGCVLENDNHSWSAKRQGFPCGIYQIDVAGHDDEAQLFVNGIKVWDHVGCCDSHSNVWTGFLDDNATVVFRGTEGAGGSNGAINLILQNSISLNGPTTICPGYSLQLTASTADSYLWSTGATTKSITVNTTGKYSVTVTSNGCSHSTSDSITVAPLDTAAISSYDGPDFIFCPAMYSINLHTNYNPLVTYLWNTGSTYRSIYVQQPGNYSLTISDALGCSATSHVSVTSNVAGTDSAFGNNVWKVNAYYQGFYSYYYYYYTSGRAWYPDDYSGYYLDSTFNFNSQNKWDQNSNPSTAPGYTGCSINDDAISWSAKRQGFPCGVYQIDVVNHDDEAELLVDGVKVWDGNTSGTNAWTGALNASSKVEFRVNEQYGYSNGAINLTLVGSTSSFISVSGHPAVCTGQSYTLTSSILGSYLWSNGETINPAHATSSGSYSVVVTDQEGCSLTSDPVSVALLPDAAPVAHISASSSSVCNWVPVTLSSDSTNGNHWSTNETTQTIQATSSSYSLKVTNGAGCYDSSSIHLNVGFTPATPGATNGGCVCEGSSATLTASGLAPGGQAASFNGINQYIEVTQDVPESNFTIEMWVKTTAANCGIFSVTNGYLGDAGNDRHLYLNNGELSARIWQGNGWGSGTTINDGSWHHIALVAQTGAGQKIYVDGNLAPNSSSYDHSDFTSQTYFNIGFSNDGSSNYFDGQIDNVRIWSEAKSQADIRSNMSLETPATSANLVYQGSLNGNMTATVGNNGTSPNGISYALPDYYTYTWTGTGAPAASTSETQTTAALSSSGTYTVTASAGGCTASSSASTELTVTPATHYYADEDGDGYGFSSATALLACTNPGAGYATNNTDCNDGNPSVNPGASEVCNGTDDNCNGSIDEGVTTTYYADADGDGYGNPNSSVQGCTAPGGYVSSNTDCNDASGSIHPGANDMCNGIDDNCDGVVDEHALNATITPGGNFSYCAGTTVTLVANGGSGTTYQWVKGKKNISGATLSTYTTNRAANYKVKESNSFGCNSTSAVTTLTQVSKPTAAITALGNLNICGTGSVTLQASSGVGYTYQWLKNGGNISGATNQNYTATTKGTYKCVVSNSTLCSATSNALKVTKSCRADEEEFITSSMKIYPNPTNGNFMIELILDNSSITSVDVQVLNLFGQVVYMNTTAIFNGELKQEINLDPNIPAGNYFVRIIASDQVITKQLIIAE